MPELDPGDQCVFLITPGDSRPARVIATNVTRDEVTLITSEDPPKVYGPDVPGYQPTENVTPVPVSTSGNPYTTFATSIDESLVTASLNNAAAATAANAVADGDGVPFSLLEGVDPGLWDYVDGIWSERFSGRTKTFERGRSANAIASIRADIVDVNDPGGTLQMIVDWAPRSGGPGKPYSFPQSILSAGTGIEQNIILSPTLQPAEPSEMRVRFTTGFTNAPVGGPFYQVIRVWVVML